MNIIISVSDYIRYKELKWYVHVQRMDKERLPQRNLVWYPPGRRRKGRLKISWMQEVTTVMRKREIGELEWIDRESIEKKTF
jgi:hypothetical protein